MALSIAALADSTSGSAPKATGAGYSEMSIVVLSINISSKGKSVAPSAAASAASSLIAAV